jgi:hypothetical protein
MMRRDQKRSLQAFGGGESVDATNCGAALVVEVPIPVAKTPPVPLRPLRECKCAVNTRETLCEEVY